MFYRRQCLRHSVGPSTCRESLSFVVTGLAGYLSLPREQKRWIGTRAHRRRSPRSAVEKRSPTTLCLQDYVAGDLSSMATCDEVWSSETVGEAWNAMNKALLGGSSSSGKQNEVPVGAESKDEAKSFDLDTLRTMDLPELAKASSRAELEQFLRCFPSTLRQRITTHPLFSLETVEEVFVHLGQPVEVVVGGERGSYMVDPPTAEELMFLLQQIGHFGSDGRGCIHGTLHRVSRWASRDGRTLGVTMRVGRYIPNCARALVDLARKGSMLVLARPGAGKTTILRDLAVSLSRSPDFPRVVVIDTSNEIGGDDDVPLPYLGRVRRIQVPSRPEQFAVMTQVLTNHNPDYVIIDEVATEEEATAVWNMCQRGVKVVATAHGETLAKLVQNKALNALVGGVAQAFLSNEERRLRAKVRKTVLERPQNSPFDYVAELPIRQQGMLYHRVNEAVDLLLDDGDPRLDRQLCTPVALTEPMLESSLPGVIRKAMVLGAVPPSAYSEAGGNEDTPTAGTSPATTSKNTVVPQGWEEEEKKSPPATAARVPPPKVSGKKSKEDLTAFLDEILGPS